MSLSRPCASVQREGGNHIVCIRKKERIKVKTEISLSVKEHGKNIAEDFGKSKVSK